MATETIAMYTLNLSHDRNAALILVRRSLSHMDLNLLLSLAAWSRASDETLSNNRTPKNGRSLNATRS
jgi:hypothetical protein